jgi:hypothetical protein
LEDDLFEADVGRLKVFYKEVNKKPQLWLAFFDTKSKLDSLKIEYEIEFANAKKSAAEYFRQRKRQKTR